MKSERKKDVSKDKNEPSVTIRMTPEEERRLRQWRERRARRQPRPGGRVPVQGETNRFGNREISDHEQDEYGWSQYYGEPFSRGVVDEMDHGPREDWMQPGPHAGKGPKGYQRPDNRIFEDVCERLTHHGQIDARNITVEVAAGEVILRGVVDSRRTKRMVEDTIENVTGVRDIHNELRIGSNDGEPAS
jgi:hypothetical protein